jgi:hypothetical protein
MGVNGQKYFQVLEQNQQRIVWLEGIRELEGAKN